MNLFSDTQALFEIILYLFINYNMYKTLISPKVYTKETDLTYRTPKPKVNPTGSGSNGGGSTPTPPVETFFLLLEDGFYILTQDNFKIKL